MRASPRSLGLWSALMLYACEPAKDASLDRTAAAKSDSGLVIASSSPWQITPGRVAGPMTARTSEADLAKHFGAATVKPTRVELGEGESTPGTVLFPDDSSKRAQIVWHDTISRSGPSRLILRGSRSQWTVGPGITLGTSLKELERINGRPFTLAGFGWDYAGVITEWGGGTLDSALAGVKLYLDPGPAQYHSLPYSQVLGDRDYSSARLVHHLADLLVERHRADQRRDTRRSVGRHRTRADRVTGPAPAASGLPRSRQRPRRMRREQSSWMSWPLACCRALSCCLRSPGGTRPPRLRRRQVRLAPDARMRC